MKNTGMLLFILLFPMAASIPGYYIGKRNERNRDVFNVTVTWLNLLVVTMLYWSVRLQPIDLSINHIMGTGLHLKLDLFRYIFVWLTSLIWFLSTLYSTKFMVTHKNQNRYYLFSMLTLGSTLGIFISENLINLFTFFEIMSFTSYALIINDEDEYCHEAGDTYIAMAVGGGLVLLMGLFLLFNYTQTLDIGKLYSAVEGIGSIKYVISALIIIGFGIKAGMVPLHIWLPKAYTAAPAPGTAVLSAILSKTGIFGIILIIDIMLKGDIYASGIIIVIGFLNMLIGGFLAVFQRNIKRILAYSSMSQIGYIFIGIGLVGLLKEHGTIAIYGTLLHAINHGLQKALLFMGAGVVYMFADDLSLNKVRGFGRKKPLLMGMFLVGVLGTAGVPGLNGYLSKTLLHEALLEAGHIYGEGIIKATEILFTIGSSFTVAYLLKLFGGLFIEKGDGAFDNVKEKASVEIYAPLIAISAAIMYIGIRPGFMIKILDGALGAFGDYHHVEVHLFTLEALKSSGIVIGLGVLIYMIVVKKLLRKGDASNWYYINPALKWFSLERNIYKPVGKLVFNICTFVFRIIDTAIVGTATWISNIFEAIGRAEIDTRDIFGKLVFKKIKLPSMDMNILDKKDELLNAVDIDEYSEGVKNLKDSIGQVAYKLNSVTYSIFIFAIVLVVSLLVIVS